MEKPEILVKKPLGMRLCVPDTYTDEQIVKFAELENSCGTTGGWHVAKEGDECLCGCEARYKCDARPGFVHVVVYC